MISIASPYTKKRYSSLIATWYASIISSYPPKAAVLIKGTVLGRWKLVINDVHTLKLYGGVINLLAHPWPAFNFPATEAADSRALMVETPTAHTCRLLSNDLLADEAVSSGIVKGSEPILYLARSSMSIMFIMLRLMCSVIGTVLISFIASRLSSWSVKCNPAAGVITAS